MKWKYYHEYIIFYSNAYWRRHKAIPDYQITFSKDYIIGFKMKLNQSPQTSENGCQFQEVNIEESYKPRSGTIISDKIFKTPHG